MELISLMKDRYSAREFDRSKPIAAETMDAILEAARLAPTGCNSQQVKIYVIGSPEALAKAEQCSACIYNAPTALLICYDDTHPDSHLEINEVNVGLVDTAIVATHAILAATELGVNTCWVCWFEQDKVMELFDLPEGWKPACFIPMGYSTGTPSERHFIRKPLDELVERV